MGEDAGVARRRRVFLGARVSVVSLAREPPPAYRTVASSTLIRLVCFGGSYGRQIVSIPREGGPVETVFERVGALDVHKAQVTACVRVPAPGGRREQHLAEFQTTVRGLLALRDWLRRPPRFAGRDGGDRCLLAAGLAHPRGRLSADAR